MQVFILALLALLLRAVGTFVGKVLLSLGIGMVVFSGVDASLDWVRDQAISHLAATGGNTLRVISTLQIGTCISILASAYTARLVLNGLTGGTVKKWVHK